MDKIALILAGIFLVNLFIAGWLVTLGLMDRYKHHKATREVDALERSLAMPAAGRDVLSARRFGGTHLAIDVRELRVSTHRAIAGRRFPVLPRFVGKASIGVALASTMLWLAVVVPDLAGRPTNTPAGDGVSVSFPQVSEVPSYRDEAPRDVDASGRRADWPANPGLTPDVPAPPPSTNTNTTFEGASVPGSVAAEPRSWTAISLAWATVPGAIGYSIERWKETPDPGWLKIATVEEAVTLYTDVGLEADTTYWYRISAITEEGPAPPSDVVSATTSIAPPAATVLTAIGVGTTIELAWVDVADETAYRIERSLHGTSEWITIGTTGQDVTAYTDAALTSGVTYRYRIVATNEGGDSAPSNIASVKIDAVKVTTPPDESPAPPEPEDSKKNKVTEETPVTDEIPVVEATPVTDEIPVVEATPVVEASPVTEESQ